MPGGKVVIVRTGTVLLRSRARHVRFDQHLLGLNIFQVQSLKFPVAVIRSGIYTLFLSSWQKKQCRIK